MERLLLSCLIFFILLSTCICAHQASFYGGSYISIPLKEAKGSTDIHIKFRTRLPNGLLLLAAGTTDYCVVYLQGGNLKVKINLGAGESEISSPKGLILNDLLWHNVTIKRKEANISLTIDSRHTVRKHLPGKFFELNIHFGVFLGGKGNFSELFLGHLESFRGCMADIRYNDMILLEQARKRMGQMEVSSITWNCAAEFETDVNKDISFVSDEAYIMFSHISNRPTFRWQTEMKSTTDHCILLYNTGFSIKSDLFAVEIWKGQVKLVIKHGTNQLEVVNDIIVSDGRWHKLFVQIGSVAELVVDGTIASAKISKPGTSHVLNLSDAYFIGGIDVTKRARAMAKGLKTSDSNFKGCLKNIVIDNHKISLSNVKVTRGLLPGCVWQYPCLNSPCLEEAKCVQRGVDSFQCECDKSLCVHPSYNEEYKIFSNSTLATDLELLTIKPLQVVEGENSLITNVNLDLVLDYPKYGIRDSGILFHVIEPPEYGTVSVDIWPRKENIFTLLDLSRDKVHYIHDGSESLKDRIVVELELSAGEPFILPAYLQGRHRFLFPIIITPMNDPPILDIPTSNVLRLAQGTEEVITNKFVQAKDPDTPPQKLVYNVLKQDKKSYGHLERLHQPDVYITSFTQQDIDNNQIIYVHHGSTEGSSHLALQVSDGIESSAVAFLRISTFTQHLRLQNNTGIILVHKSFVHITPYNLSFTSNTKDKQINVKYEIVKPPDFGSIELEKHDDIGVWKSIDSFTSEEIQQRRIRYRHTKGNPEHDEFKFRASLRYINSSTVYSFRMTFTKLNLFMVHQKVVHLNSSSEAILTNSHLSYQTQPLFTNPSYIIYQISVTPTYGYLYLPLSKYKLRGDNSFTQEDINLNNIKYRLHRHTYSHISDRFTLTVIAPGCNNLTSNVTINYNPSKEVSSKVHYKMDRLQVTEGSKVNLALSHLSIKVNNVTTFTFNITEKPNHGLIQVNGGQGKEMNDSQYFTLTDLMNDVVYYIHDDSESRHDSFKFLALSNEKEDVQYAGEFHINVVLRNDNGPVRSVDKIFHIVTGGTKLLTGTDLRYSDADIDTKLSDIVYSCREITNGAVYRVENPNQEILEFTQEDLDNELLLFKHKGDEYGTIKFWVNDGQFDSNGVLEIQASVPFIKTLNSKILVVEHGNSMYITSEELLVVTNLNTKYDKVVYELTSNPLHGKLMLFNSESEIKQFTQLDVNTARVMYKHDGSQTKFDEIKFRVRCQDITSIVRLSVRILPSIYWQPLLLVNNKSVLVEESTSIAIVKDNLEIIQPQVSPDVITYYVVDPPQHGYIEVQNVKNKDDANNNKQFSQEMINLNQIHYVQSSANETRDQIAFNVTNGIVWMNNVILNIVVIPEYLYLGTKTLTVTEGREATLSTANIFVVTDYYRNSVTDFLVVQAPKYGCLKVHKSCNLTHNFSHKDLKLGLLKYLHDDGENLIDEITVVGLAGQIRSIPVVLIIKVFPVNDQKPDVFNNTGLVMWEGGVEALSNEMLGAVDEDFPKETLTYNVIGCWWGNISVKGRPNHSVRTFTQNDIDNGLVLFRHANGSEAKFVFTVTDGIHTTKEHSFIVRTKPVRLILQRLFNLHIFPLHRTYLTTSDLLVTVSDPDREIVYKVITPPSLGRLMMESDMPGNLRIVQTFTQSDINGSRVFYEHTHPFVDLYVNDSFAFDVHAHLADSIYNQRMTVDISVSSGGLDEYISVNKVEVPEGGLTSLKLNLSGVVSFLESHAGVIAPIIHVSASQPGHGIVQLAEHTNLTTFTQQQIESGQVKYQHDHSDSMNDSILFSLYLIPDYISLCNVTVYIKVNPINDQPFKLVTSTPRIQVVQGENCTITRNDLLTEDADTDPADLNYVIVNSPAEGKLVLLSNRDESQNTRVVHNFSQADINANRVVYLHAGSSPHVTFYFRVDDGKFKPEYTLFNIQIIPVLINAISGIPVYLQQGSNVASLSMDQFVIDTNAAISKVHYSITKPPKHGVLYVRDTPSVKFVQADLDAKSVMYVQTDITTANDTFKVFVGIPSDDNNIGSIVDVMVKVQPLMQIGNFTAVTGVKNKLSISVLDATPLAKLTNSNPKYVIIHKPHLGQIRKIIRSSGENRNIVDDIVKVFTHEEVKSGLIYYVAQNIAVDWRGIEDKFVFILAASIFQPAIGELRFRVRPSLANSAHPTLAGPSDPAGHEGGMQMASPNMSSDYFLIVTMVAGVIILGIAVIVVIKCSRTFDHEGKDLDKDSHMLQPIPLPRPPDQLISTSPHMKRYMSDNFSIPTAMSTPLPASMSVPQCKVTPLRPINSVENSELDVHARYPYGASDDQAEDWSSYDTPDPTYARGTNLMLRKNQYWV